MSLPNVPFVTERFLWRGVTIEVRYTPSWLDFYETIYGRPLALMEVTSLSGEPLPITSCSNPSNDPAAD